MKFHEKLTMLRKGAGMSQEELAEKLEVSRQAVSRWEAGSTLPDAGNLLKLSDLFGVTIDALLRDERSVQSGVEMPQALHAHGEEKEEAAPSAKIQVERVDRRKRDALLAAMVLLLMTGAALAASGWILRYYIAWPLWRMGTSIMLGALCLFAAGFCGFRLYLVTHSATEEAKTRAQAKLAFTAAVFNLMAAVCFSFAAGWSDRMTYWFLTAVLTAGAVMEFSRFRKLKYGK